ncbi:MAG: recombinase family protein, partial [Candidatus Binataceae bacterium]
CSFSRGALYELLANPIHSGEIRHKQERYPGQHEATVPRELWEGVQQRLRVNTAHGSQSSTSAIASPLAGKIFDADGEPLYAQGAAKAGRRYRYYVSRSLVTGFSSDERKSWRLAAPEIERAVAIAAQHILGDRAGLLEELERSEVQSADIRATIESISALCRRLENEANTKACMVELIDRIELRDDGVRVTLKIRVPCSRAGVQTNSILDLSRFVPLKMKRRGVETRIIIAAGDEPPRKVDSALLKAVARARMWFDELASGRVRSLAEIARTNVLASATSSVSRAWRSYHPQSWKRSVRGNNPQNSMPRRCSSASICCSNGRRNGTLSVSDREPDFSRLKPFTSLISSRFNECGPMRKRGSRSFSKPENGRNYGIEGATRSNPG